LIKNNIDVYPKIMAPDGYMSYMASELGPYPVMNLFAAGAKVGEMMSRNVSKNISVFEAAKLTLDSDLAMDFKGNLAWI
jgi:hypothetical protein